mgnify:CR=1 FL=1
MRPPLGEYLRAFRIMCLNKPGDALHGLTITVPADAYTGDMPIEISSAPITSTTFDNVTPATPMITVDNGGVFTNDIMTVKIPVVIPDGQFAMGFFYDADKQRLEAIPAMDITSTYITVGTCHFSSFFVSLIDEL